MACKGRDKGKLKIQRIMDNTKRKLALWRRLPIVLKKARELAVLCDVPVCVLVYPPGEAQPVVWPLPGAAADVLCKYRDQPDLVRFKDELDSADFLKKRNEKLKVELSELERQTRDAEINLVIVDFLAGRRKSFDDLPTDFLGSISWTVQNKLLAIKTRLQELRSGVVVAPALHPPCSPAPFTHPNY